MPEVPCLSVAVAIPTRNRGVLIADTLQALEKQGTSNIEILVIDQSTNSETATAVLNAKKIDPRIRLISTKTIGSSSARNVAPTTTAADIIAYLDDDCIPAEGWLDAIVTEFEQTNASAVYGRLLPFETTSVTGTEVGYKPALKRREFVERSFPWYIGHGGNMAFRRHDLLEVGGFDPLLGAGGLFGACEDPDIAYRLLRMGKRIVYSPTALAYHKHWKTWSAQQKMERYYGIGAGAQFSKYIRGGDRYGFLLLATWIWQLGIRRIGSGLLKWRSTRVMYLGYCQLLYPWIGIGKSLREKIDPESFVYVDTRSTAIALDADPHVSSDCL